MSTESTFDYDGPLSTYREGHAGIVGLALGLTIGWSPTLRTDLRREPHYAVAGVLAGIALGAALRPEGGCAR